MTMNAPFKIVQQTHTRDLSSEKLFKLVQFNCNGLFSRLSELKLYLFTVKPDVVCLCETWVRGNPPKFPGYQAVWQNCPVGMGGGLCTLVRSDISFREVKLSIYDGGNLKIQAVSVMSVLGLFEVINVYNPCKNVSYNEFIFYVKQFVSKFIIVGDFNAHSPVWDVRGRTNVTGRTLEQLLEEGVHGHG